jgi:hypothetical protein
MDMKNPAAPFAPMKFATLHGKRMAYIDEGKGDAIVFARQSDILVSVAQHHAALSGTRAAYRLRPDWHGRL